ncbi:hypothetical protein [Marihabitans asiaticum]|uniref:hypothetical protein n=1 Tax=Marihabitans asiaticum TaxID=415218 RepID=UPI0014787C3E|nr:hypothetical protein [Marihabitans asiaticum]
MSHDLDSTDWEVRPRPEAGRRESALPVFVLAGAIAALTLARPWITGLFEEHTALAS